MNRTERCPNVAREQMRGAGLDVISGDSIDKPMPREPSPEAGRRFAHELNVRDSNLRWQEPRNELLNAALAVDQSLAIVMLREPEDPAVRRQERIEVGARADMLQTPDFNRGKAIANGGACGVEPGQRRFSWRTRCIGNSFAGGTPIEPVREGAVSGAADKLRGSR